MGVSDTPKPPAGHQSVMPALWSVAHGLLPLPAPSTATPRGRATGDGSPVGTGAIKKVEQTRNPAPSEAEVLGPRGCNTYLVLTPGSVPVFVGLVLVAATLGVALLMLVPAAVGLVTVVGVPASILVAGIGGRGGVAWT